MSALGAAVTRIRTWVASATTKSTNHYTITANELKMLINVEFEVNNSFESSDLNSSLNNNFL